MKPGMALVKLAPLLKEYQTHMKYHIITGDESIFTLVTTSQRGTAVTATTGTLPVGKHTLMITAAVLEDADNETKIKLAEVTREVRKFQLKVYITVVDN